MPSGNSAISLSFSFALHLGRISHPHWASPGLDSQEVFLLGGPKSVIPLIPNEQFTGQENIPSPRAEQRGFARNRFLIREFF
jgi:hypothetical protein